MCGGGPLPGNPTSSNSANAPPVSLPSALNVTSSRSPIQTDLPSPAATCVGLTVDFLLPSWHDVTLADYRLPGITTPITRKKIRCELPRITLPRTPVHKGNEKGRGAMPRPLSTTVLPDELEVRPVVGA